MSTAAVRERSSSAEEAPRKKPKRTYRACYPCRSRKLKCNFGEDPNRPWNGPCLRCIREQRECVRSMPTVVRYSLPGADGVIAFPHELASGSATTATSTRPTVITTSTGEVQPTRTHSKSTFRNEYQGPSPRDDHFDDAAMDAHHHGRAETPPSSGGDDGGSALVSSNLQNPNDALKLLASASSLRYRNHEENHGSPSEPIPDGIKGNASPWLSWSPIAEGHLTEQEGGALLCFFELRMAPLYPLLHPAIFATDYLDALVRSESLLLGAIIVIASRYSNVLDPTRASTIHVEVAKWVRSEFAALIDGDATLRTVSTVEALLLLSEWPMLPLRERQRAGPDSEEARLLRPSLRFDAYCWGNIGWAVRLAQELGMEEVVFQLPAVANTPDGWKQDRILKSYIYCYNAEQHIATRLGRNAVMQPNKSTAWWESLSREVNCAAPEGASTDAWRSDLIPPACNAQLMCSIQQHLYWSKELTHTLLRTGAWESFMRSLHLDMDYSSKCCESKLSSGTVSGSLLQLEFDYMVLYANSLALRSLQGRMRRGRAAKDPAWETPSLLNMVEGKWVIGALDAARSIIDIALNVLQKRQYLRYCPSRIFQYILFATTFLYKALASGVVEHGESSVAGLLERTVAALSAAAIDDEHFLAGFAVLLARLGKHWHGPKSDSSGVFRRHASSAAESQPTPSSYGAPPTLQVNGQFPSAMDTVGEGLHFGDMPSAHQLPGHALQAPSGISDSFMWQLDLTSHMPAADLEQDMLFQSIWDAHSDAAITSSNLYATLLGGAVLDFPDTA